MRQGRSSEIVMVLNTPTIISAAVREISVPLWHVPHVGGEAS